MYKEELSFLESCLGFNPKSYGSWEHRCFVMLHTPTPDWERELSLCTTFLTYDDRNCKYLAQVVYCESTRFRTMVFKNIMNLVFSV